jgi:CheY-like chemotaxis protein
VQADSSTTRKYGGPGLGIPIAKSMIELMGGALSVESTPRIGSMFSFEITFAAIDAPVAMPAHPVAVDDLQKPLFEGEVLLCEDNPMNQRVMCGHLARVGLRAIVAQNGKEGVDIVRKRKENGEKPFDLILMDIHMPVMDGLEAASAITALGVATPIVAATANVMVDDKNLYRSCGILDCLSKPFTSRDLWRCLMQYLAPVGRTVVEHAAQMQEDERLHTWLRTHFVKNNQTAAHDIREAAAKGDIKLARRLAHTLKGDAGQIGENGLRHAAAEVEGLLKDGKAPDAGMNLLEAELREVLRNYAPLLDEIGKPPEPLDAAQALALLDQLESMLKNKNPECLRLLDKLRAVPGAEELSRHVENLDFKPALAALDETRKRVEP